MRIYGQLLQPCRITLFTRAHCGLCTEAKSVLSELHAKRPFDFQEIDIIKPEAQSWRDLYDMDVPVIHISNSKAPPEDPKLASKALKLMHRFTAEEVTAQMKRAEDGNTRN